MLNVALDIRLSPGSSETAPFHLALNFAAEPGKTTVLLGESGAGKSTVLRLLAGLLHPQQGHISLDGTTYFDSEQRIAIPPQQRPFGYVFQDYILFPHLSAYENVAFGLRAQHLSRHLIQQRVSEALDRVQLSSYQRRKPEQLSGGQQQRVAIARALALQPQLLLLDEPLSALDVQTRREVRNELRRILDESGITTIMVTHHYLEALLFGHSILVLDHGRIIQQGSQRDLLEYPRSPYVAELVGVNFFRGHITAHEADNTATIQLAESTPPIEIIAMLKERANETPPQISDQAYIVVPPQSVALHQTPPESSARNTFRGEIVQILRLGTLATSPNSADGRVRISIALPGNSATPLITSEITEASAERMNLTEGKTIYATFKAVEASAYT